MQRRYSRPSGLRKSICSSEASGTDILQMYYAMQESIEETQEGRSCVYTYL